MVVAIAFQMPTMTLTDLWVGQARIVVFLIWCIVSLILINLLIALMTSTYEDVKEKAEKMRLLEVRPNFNSWMTLTYMHTSEADAKQ